MLEEYQFNEKDARRLIKECFWDYNLTVQDIFDMAKSDNSRLQKKLFDKIIYNSSDKSRALKAFNPDDLKKLFEQFTPSQNLNFINKIIPALRNILLNEKNVIPSLKWKKR
jgi:hypothetical protein